MVGRLDPAQLDRFCFLHLDLTDVGVSQVTAALYYGIDTQPLQNQHYFTVYWLKLESLKLGDALARESIMILACGRSRIPGCYYQNYNSDS